MRACNSLGTTGLGWVLRQEVAPLRAGSAAVSFDEIGHAGEFYGIWACASLLHATRQSLHRVLDKLVRALKPNGILYLSFKYGDAERIEDGRYFNDLNEVSLNVVLNRHPVLDVGQVWTPRCTARDRPVLFGGNDCRSGTREELVANTAVSEEARVRRKTAGPANRFTGSLITES
jgi:hypothetical protein